jgi:Amt family ammonium transporter
VGGRFGLQGWIKDLTGAEFHDFAGSVVVHAVGGWIGLVAVLLLGARHNRYRKDGAISAHPPSSIPFLALGAWVLAVGWFGFNVMSAQTIDKISGLVAVNSLMAMAAARWWPPCWAATTPASPTTARWPAWWPCAPAPT